MYCVNSSEFLLAGVLPAVPCGKILRYASSNLIFFLGKVTHIKGDQTVEAPK